MIVEEAVARGYISIRIQGECFIISTEK